MVVKDKVITGLSIINASTGGNCVYEYGECSRNAQNAPRQPQSQSRANAPAQSQNLAQSAQQLLSPRQRLNILLQERNIDVRQYMKANNLSKETPDAEVIRMIGELEQLPPVPNNVS